MKPKSKIPRREYLAAVFPLACSVILLTAALSNAAGRHHGWAVVLICFAAGAAFPLSYSLKLYRERRLFLGEKRAIERNRARIAVGQPIGWLLGLFLVAAGVGLGGVSRAGLLAALAGLAFGFWPGLLANFVRLRREHHWG